MNLTFVVCFVVVFATHHVIGRKFKPETTSSSTKYSIDYPDDDEEYSDESPEKGSSPENEETQIEERLVTDLKIIYGSHGVSVNYKYNETGNDNKIKSAPGCPKSIDGFPWIYYGNPPRCYLAGHNGPCGFREKLLVKKNSNEGFCACECVVDGIQNRSKHVKFRRGIRYISCQDYGMEKTVFGQVFDIVKNACYEPLTQGPCAVGELLVFSNSTSVQCFPSCGDREYKVGNGCHTLPVVQTGLGFITSNSCSDNEKYSDTLKQCIKKDQDFQFA